MGWQLLRRAGAAGCLALAAACGDPCKDLALKVCDCGSTPAQRELCAKQVAARQSQVPANPDVAQERAQRAQCAALIDGCSCAALGLGDLQACGLSAEPALIP